MSLSHPLHVDECHLRPRVIIIFAEEKIPSLAVAVDQGQVEVTRNKVIQSRSSLRNLSTKIPAFRYQVLKLGKSLQ